MDLRQSEVDKWRDRCQRVAAMYPNDEEVAHSAEDGLLEDFIADLAQGAIQNPQAVAEAIKAELHDLPRTRWYA